MVGIPNYHIITAISFEIVIAEYVGSALLISGLNYTNDLLKHHQLKFNCVEELLSEGG